MNSQTTTQRVAAVLFAVFITTSMFIAFIPMNVSANSDVTVVSTTPTNNGDYPGDSYVKGDTLYITSGFDIEVYDISDKTNPVYLTSFSTTGGVFDIEVDEADDRLISMSVGQLTVIDISTADSPTLVDQMSVNNYLRGIAVDDDSNHIFSITNGALTNKVERFEYDGDTLSKVSEVETSTSYDIVYDSSTDVIYFGDGASPTTIKSFDVSDPVSMTQLDSSLSSELIDVAPDVMQITGSTLLFGTNNGNVISYDIGNPSNISENSVTDVSPSSSNDAAELEISGNQLVVYSGTQLSFADISDPANPSYTSQTSLNPGVRGAIGITGDYIIVGVDGVQEFQILEKDGLKPSNTLSGVVEDDSGTPVANATVEIYGVDHSQITAATGQSLEERAQELLAEAKDPFPATWQPDLSLLNFFDSAEEDYVAVHSANVMPNNRFFDGKAGGASADLDTPQLTVAADTPIVMTVWDPTAGDTLENAVDEDLPGKTTDGTVVIKKLSMSGEILDTKEIETKEVYKTGVAPFSKTHEGVRLSLGQGFYEVSPEGSSNSYVIASVGDMSIEEMGTTYATNLEDSANRITDRATKIDNKLTSGEFGRIVVETDANGEFTADVPSAFSTVDVTAYKAGDFLSSVDLDQRSISELQKELEAAEYGGSIYIPTQTQTVSTPFPSNVNVEVKEVLSIPNTGGVDTTGAEDVVNKTINSTVGAAEDLIDPDAWDSSTDAQKEELYNSLLRTVLGNDELEACIIDGAEEAGISSTYAWDSVDDATAERQVVIMTTCIGTTSPIDTPLPDDIEGGAEEVKNGAGDVIDYVLNLRIPFAGSLNPDTASVIVRYADGSFETMGEDYWSVDEGILGTDAVVIEDYPLPSDQAMASVEILASDEDGVDKGSVDVRNPAFNGETPALQAIKLNTLAPGAGQSVQLDVSPTDDSSFKSVKSAKVWDGDGNELSSTLNNGQLTFTAAGEGSHLVKLTVDDTDGNEYVERLRIGAQEDDLPYDPSIRVKKGFLGTYAVVGDGAIDGEISQRNDVTTVGVTLADGENPSAVRVHLNELDETDNIKVRLMQGSSQQSYDKFTTVFVYTSQLSEDSLVYRDGNQPISVDKGKYGVRMDKTDAELIVTYTDTDGTVDLGVNNDPSFVDRILFSVREQLGGISDGLSLGVILIPPVVLARRNGDSL